MKKRPGVVIGSVLVVVALAAQAWAQAPVDPQSLVGEWWGSWTSKRGGPGPGGVNNGPYSLQIERVEGSTVYGRGEVSGQRTSEFRFAGTVDGNRLTFGREIVVDLLIVGDQMTGGSHGMAARNITLTKRK
jgi:hypothetical protein